MNKKDKLQTDEKIIDSLKEKMSKKKKLQTKDEIIQTLMKNHNLSREGAEVFFKALRDTGIVGKKSNFNGNGIITLVFLFNILYLFLGYQSLKVILFINIFSLIIILFFRIRQSKDWKSID